MPFKRPFIRLKTAFTGTPFKAIHDANTWYLLAILLILPPMVGGLLDQLRRLAVRLVSLTEKGNENRSQGKGNKKAPMAGAWSVSVNRANPAPPFVGAVSLPGLAGCFVLDPVEVFHLVERVRGL
jgi:hypothetical protein